MTAIGHLDFDLLIEPSGQQAYRAYVVNSPVGQASVGFTVPDSVKIPGDLVQIQPHLQTSGSKQPTLKSLEIVGKELFNTVFADEVGTCFRRSLDHAETQKVGLRLRLRLTDVPDLAGLPWECLYSTSLKRFLALSQQTPIVRFLDLPERVQPLLVKPPIKILVMISNSGVYAPLDAEQEWSKLSDSLSNLRHRGLVHIEQLPKATLTTLQQWLRKEDFHIFHFIGHGSFDKQTQDGVLILEDAEKYGQQVSGKNLGMLLRDHRALRLVVLNSCEGAGTSRTDSFSGVAQNLVRQGIPAVIAMQFAISDLAAITLAHEFYGALADQYPVDAALAEARKAIYNQDNNVEWGTPVLFMRSSDGRIFNFDHQQAEVQGRQILVDLKDAHKKKKPIYKRVESILAGVVLLVGLFLLLIPSIRQRIMERLGMENSLPRNGLLVLPFRNVGNDPNHQVFCDGMMETVTSQLSQLDQLVSSLWIVPAVEVYDKQIRSAREARRLFGVNVVVTGSIQYQNSLVRVTVDIVETNTLKQKSFIMTKSRENLLALQDSISIKIAQMLGVNLNAQALSIITMGGTTVPGAYEFCLQGYGYLQRPEKTENIDNAIELFMRAIQFDSLYALSYNGLAYACMQKYDANHDTQWFDDAVKYCETALELDSAQANIRITLGQIYNMKGEFIKAIDEFRKALGLNPNSADAYIRLGVAYAQIANHNEAEAVFQKAIALKPDYWIGYNFLGDFYLKQGRYEEGAKQFLWVIKLTPDNIWGYNNAGAAFLNLENLIEAAQMFNRSISILPNDFAYSNLGSLYYFEQRFDKAAQMYEKALELNGNDYRVWGNLASAYSRASLRPRKEQEAYRQAIQLAENQKKVNPGNPDVLADLAVYYLHLGEKKQARILIDQVTTKELKDPYLLYLAGCIYEQLNEREIALNFIEKALQNGYLLTAIEQDPELERLRNDERFHRLQQKEGNKIQ